MGLLIYDSVDPSAAFSISGGFTNPLTHSFNGTTGEVVERRYYVRNDNVLYWYDSITVQPVVKSGNDIVSEAGLFAIGYSWKVLAGDSKPLEEQWILKPAGQLITLADIGSVGTGDITTYLPFWLRIRIPPNSPVASYQGVILQIDYTEGLV